MRFNGRILLLGTAPDAVARQLAGVDLNMAEVGPLRDDISTDEITPLPILLNFDHKLARYAHTGTVIGQAKPILENAVLKGGFSVLVAGKRYGKGSSREHAPLAELSAGIRLVIAESFERIYRQNCDNLGIFTSTDFGLIGRIRAGQDITLEDLLKDREPLAAAIVRAGGLLPYGQQHLKQMHRHGGSVRSPQTLAEKIIARHTLQTTNDSDSPDATYSGFVQPDWRFIHEYYTAMASHLLQRQFPDGVNIEQPQSVILFEDHLSYASRSPTHVSQQLLPAVDILSREHRDFAKQHGLRNHGYLFSELGSEGISHAMMTEQYALPGQLIAGTDSHTPHSGALGCFAYGVGTTDMANAFVTGATRLSEAPQLLIRLSGSLPRGVTAKDVALFLLASDFIRRGGGLGRVFEFAGPVISAMSIDERATLTNMVAELGGLTGICAPDQTTVAFLKERRGIEFELEPWMCSDDGATYEHTIDINCSALSPMIAKPSDPGNGISINELEQDVTIDIAYGGSCTAGKRADFDQYHEVAQWALNNNLGLAPGVTLYLQCATLEVRQYCEEQGYLETFRRLGAELLAPACGACGQCGPGVSTNEGQVTISAINRNFPGRTGPGKVWLGSPSTVLASAIAGKITSFDLLISSTSP